MRMVWGGGNQRQNYLNGWSGFILGSRQYDESSNGVGGLNDGGNGQIAN